MRLMKALANAETIQRTLATTPARCRSPTTRSSYSTLHAQRTPHPAG
jgi:hypothetical protein